MGIIGVVAALTLPNLIQKYQDRVLTSRFKKGYSELSRAWGMVIAEDPYKYLNTHGGWFNMCSWPDGADVRWDSNFPSDDRTIALRSKMKVQKICTSNESDCWPSSYEKYIDAYGNLQMPVLGNLDNNYNSSWITSDGMCFNSGRGDNSRGEISMDTNCNEGPNRLGDDIFVMILGVDGIVYFATDSRNTEGAPVRSGSVCPFGEFTPYRNPRKVLNFRDRLQK